MHDHSNPKSPTCLQELLDYRLFMAYRDCSAVTEATCRAEFGVGGRHWRIIATIAENQSSTVNQVAEVAELDVFQTSRAVGQLVRQGLVTRGARAGNRRFAEVSLTAQGAELHAKMFRRYAELNRSLLESLDPAIIGKLEDCLSALVSRAKQLMVHQPHDAAS